MPKITELPVASATDGTEDLVIVQSTTTKKIKLNRSKNSVNVRDHGAVCDGTTDDTTALQAAINAVKANANYQTIDINGALKFNPSLLTFSGITKKIKLRVHGSLVPTTTITMDGSFEIEGVGGARAGIVQFTIGSCCTIVAPAGSIPVIKTTSANDLSLKNISITSCYQGIYLDGANQLGALCRMENVNILCDQAGGTPLVVDAFFWLWAKNCKFLTFDIASKSIKITNTSVTYSAAGLHYFEDCITAGRGISVNPAVGTCGNIYFKNHHHESRTSGEDLFFAKAGTNNVTFDNLGDSDPIGGGYTFDVAGVYAFNVYNSYAPTFRNYPISGDICVDSALNYSNATYDIGTGAAMVGARRRGAIHGRMLNRGYSALVSPSLGTTTTVPLPAGVSGDLTFTAGQRGPDGSTKATKVQYTGAGTEWSINLVNTPVALNSGDYVILSGMMKPLDKTTGVHPDSGAFYVGYLGQVVAPLTGNGRTTAEAGTLGPDHAIADDGWVPFVAAYRCTANAASNITCTISVRNPTAGALIFGTAYRVIPATYGFTDSDIIRLISATSVMPLVTSGAGTVALLDHQPFRSGLDTTANRPSAVNAGKGATFYDTTLSKPIWSDGTVWRDAAGTAV